MLKLMIFYRLHDLFEGESPFVQDHGDYYLFRIQVNKTIVLGR